MDININLDKNNINVLNYDGISFYNADFIIHFFGIDIQRNNDDFTFTYSLKDDYGIIKEFDGDFNNLHKVLSRWAGVHVTDRVSNLIPDAKYYLTINTNYLDEDMIFELEFSTTLPPKPYPTWLWDQTMLEWIAPIPYPEDGFYYEWDEFSNSWLIVDVTDS